MSERAQPFTIGQPSVMKRLWMLESAGLVTRSVSARTVRAGSGKAVLKTPVSR
jgi:hypothetical protein